MLPRPSPPVRPLSRPPSPSLLASPGGVVGLGVGEVEAEAVELPEAEAKAETGVGGTGMRACSPAFACTLECSRATAATGSVLLRYLDTLGGISGSGSPRAPVTADSTWFSVEARSTGAGAGTGAGAAATMGAAAARRVRLSVANCIFPLCGLNGRVTGSWWVLFLRCLGDVF